MKFLLSDFKCPKDYDLEEFITRKAIRFEQCDKCRTFLIVDEDNVYTTSETFRILGYFSLLSKSIKLPKDMSKSKRKDLDGMDKNAEEIECYLIGQLAKNNTYEDIVDGSMVLDRAIDMIRKAQSIVGKRIVLIECSNSPKIMDFYMKNGFVHIGRNDENNLEQMILKLEKNI